MERQVNIVREHVLAGRQFDSIGQADAAFTDWLGIRLAQAHRTHGQVIGVRGQVDRAALAPLPPAPFLVDDRHLRAWVGGVGKDALISFEASLYSVPARRVRPGQRVELRADPDTVAIHALDGDLLATHPRAPERGSWVIDPDHWAGLPDGHTRATTLQTTLDHTGTATGTVIELPVRDHGPREGIDARQPLAALLQHRRGADIQVARRPLSDYAALEHRQATGRAGR